MVQNNLDTSVRRVLVIRGGAIGDFILTLPVLAALRARWPTAWLEVLGYPHIADLAVAGRLADRARAIEGREWTPLFAPNATVSDTVADYLAGFDLIISYLYDLGGVFAANVRRHTAATFIAGPHRPDAAGPTHAAEAFLTPLQELGGNEPDPTPRLRVTATPASAGRWLAAHPGSGSDRKNWPEARWQELLRQLAEASDWNLLLVGGEAEGDRLDRLTRVWPAHRLELARSRPLTELAARLAACHGFVGHDSGITHLAAAVGLPGLALWGDTPLAVWRPRSERIQCLQAPGGLGELEVAAVRTSLLDVLGGAPDRAEGD